MPAADDDIDPTHHGGITVEVERCRDCGNHQWCSNHREEQYEEYEEKVKSAILTKLAGGPDIRIEVNPGPKAIGMDVRESQHKKGFFQAMVKNPINNKYLPDVSFCYPRIGSFEVTVMRGGVRNNPTRSIVFSKLKAKRWPNPEWVAEKVVEVVNNKLGGFGPDSSLAMSPNLNKRLPKTTEELIKYVMEKYFSMLSAFREYDGNSDGLLTKTEFVDALRSCGLEQLTKGEIAKLWQMADGKTEVDLATGELVSKMSHRHFGRVFERFLPHHEHFVGLSPKSLKSTRTPGGMGGSSSPSTRKNSDGILGQEGAHAQDLIDDVVLGSHPLSPKNSRPSSPKIVRRGSSNSRASLAGHKPSISQLSRMKEVQDMPLEQCTPDLIRAKILARTGSLTNAFKQFDENGDGQINADEFERRMPFVLGVKSVPDRVMEDLFETFDKDLSGKIELNEFLSEECFTDAHALQQKFLQQFVMS
ncbi:unnamed protein product [Amoebophrya sp. A120]|nr:unnamed protein product [Amoebophrya sp. A120]|eukprot:GSA120T00009611001.1